MRIRHVVPRAGGIGGIQQFAGSVVPWLGEDVDVDTVTWAAPGRVARAARAVSAMTGLPVGRGGSRQAVDITHFWHTRAALAVKAGPHVVTCHGTEVLLAGLPRWEQPAFRAALTRADAVVANSAYTRDYLVSAYGLPAERVHVVTPGVGPTGVRPEPAAGGGPAQIGSLCRLVRRKNLPTVVDALTVLKVDHGLDLEFRLAGDGPEREAVLEALQRSGIGYSYLGRVSEHDKRTFFYPGLDVFVLPTLQSPSDVEGFGIVYLEANAAGVPVVASATGGVVDAVSPGVSGLFADPEDPADIARAVLELLADRDRYRTLATGWAADHSEERSGARLRTVYDQLMVGAPATG